MTAPKVLEFRSQPDLFSGSQSNTERLPNGNTLVNWSDIQSGAMFNPIVLVEARPDGSATWQLSIHSDRNRIERYWGYPVNMIAGEEPAEPTVFSTN